MSEVLIRADDVIKLGELIKYTEESMSDLDSQIKYLSYDAKVVDLVSEAQRLIYYVEDARNSWQEIDLVRQS